jgi:hypothetical protein
MHNFPSLFQNFHKKIILHGASVTQIREQVMFLLLTVRDSWLWRWSALQLITAHTKFCKNRSSCGSRSETGRARADTSLPSQETFYFVEEKQVEKKEKGREI